MEWGFTIAAKNKFILNISTSRIFSRLPVRGTSRDRNDGLFEKKTYIRDFDLKT